MEKKNAETLHFCRYNNELFKLLHREIGQCLLSAR